MRHTSLTPLPLLIGALLCSALALPCSAQETKGLRSFPNTKNGIFIFYDQPPYTMTDPQIEFFARNYAGCQKIYGSLAAILHQRNPNFIVLNYRLAFGTYDTIPGYIVGDGFVNDWDSTSSHPDWFLTDPGSPNPGGRIRQQDWTWFVMDISGEINGNRTNGWKEYWARSVLNQLRSTGSDGVFADSYGIPWNLDYTPGWLQPPQDVAWIRHMNIFGNAVKQQLASAPEKFYFIPNIGPWITTRDTTSYGLYADGVMIEMFASPGPWDLYDIDDWRLEMNRILGLEAMGRIVICQPIVEDEWAASERMYNLANYLLIKGEKTFINIVFGENFFGRLIYMPEYRLPLGAYTGSLPANIDQLWDPARQVYVREYENGKVLVNPTWDSLLVPLDKEYYMVDIDALGANPRVEIGEDGLFNDSIPYMRTTRSIPVRAKSGIVLLNSIPTAIAGDPPAPARKGVAIDGISPHPITGGAEIRFSLPSGFDGAEARLFVTDLLGRRVAMKELGLQRRGWGHCAWDGRGSDGALLSAGAYLLTLEATSFRSGYARASRVLIVAR